MTVTEVKNQVLSHFITKTLFSEADMAGIRVPDDTVEWRSELVRIALGELETAGLLKKVGSAGKEAWVLVRPLNSFAQQFQISAGAAEAIGNCVNGFVAANGLDWQVCDKTNLNEGDVMTLVDIVHILLDEQTGEPLPHDRN